MNAKVVSLCERRPINRLQQVREEMLAAASNADMEEYDRLRQEYDVELVKLKEAGRGTRC